MSAESWHSTVNALWAQAFVDELIRCGVEVVGISPGSRSTPLVVECGRRDEIEDISIVDERSAGFFALGCAKATGRAAALICTSGTAAANLYPAICEASACGVGLLVLTADRPRQLQGVGASQAMDQLKLYGDHVRAFYQVGQPEATADKLRYLRGLACRGVAAASGAKPGPVHLNFSFRKPLAPVDVDRSGVDAVAAKLFDEAPLAVGGRSEGAPWLRIDGADGGVEKQVVSELRDRLVAAKRPIIFAGAVESAEPWGFSLLEMAADHRVPVIAESTSGLRYGSSEASPAVITTGDLLVESGLYDELGTPDLVLRFGRAPISWPMRRWMPQLRQAEHILVSAGREPQDPDQLACWQIRCDASRLVDDLIDELDEDGPLGDDNWFQVHRRADQQVRGHIAGQLSEEATLSAPIAWHILGESLVAEAALFVSSSMPIRDIETFFASPASAVDVLANRGVNGIDGVLSTGFGVAARRDGPTVIVVGDVAFRHDIGALLMAEQLDVDATVMVIDNGGGAIFDYLPLAELADDPERFGETLGEVYERHFRTPRRLPVGGGRFGPVEVELAETPGQLRDSLATSQQRRGVQVVVVDTDADADRALRRRVVETASQQWREHAP